MIKRYTNKNIEYIWSDENRFRIWERIELEYLKEFFFAKEKQTIDFSSIPLQRPELIKEHEKTTKHEMVAFLKELSARLTMFNNDFVSKYLHYGLTSSDIIDTGFSLQIKGSINYILHLINTLNEEITLKIYQTQDLKSVGRTHGKHAEEIIYSSRFKLLAHEIELARTELINAKKYLYGKISGPVGTSSFVDKIVARKTLKNLNLKETPIATQIIPRHLYVKPIYALTMLMLAYERFSTQVRLSSIDEVNEVQEGFSKGQAGSSAMPHKNNPIISENIAGLTRIVKANLQATLDNTNLWFERDISHSSAERIIFPDTFNILAHTTQNMIKLLKNMYLNTSEIEENLYFSNSFSHEMLLELSKKTSRFEAYEKVQKETNSALKA
jgi:adenylosuccinate lyase